MPRLLDLPLELTFNKFATPILYRRIYIFPWHKNSKAKVVSLFLTLAECSKLAMYVQRLEIRDFPKGTSSPCHVDLLELCVKGIRNCINLISCTWTRDGSLRSEVLDSLRHCPELQELEINGSSTQYDPNALTRLKKLRKISVIMPNAQVLSIFPTWTSVTHATLRSLTIICKSSSLVTDTVLESLSTNLDQLDHLLIAGCPKVSHEGVGALVCRNRNGLLTLNLEGLSQSFGMNAFQTRCNSARTFRRLRSLTLTLPTKTLMSHWIHDVEELLKLAPLEFLQLNSTESLKYSPIVTDLWRIITTHRSRLRCFSLHRVQMSLPALHLICSQCPVLEQLFVAVEQQELEVAVRLFSLVRNLRTLHISTAFTANESSTLPSTMAQIALFVVSRCSPTLTHIGCNTQVWQVQRVVHEDEKGEKYTVPTLVPPESPEIPEQFLVARV